MPVNSILFILLVAIGVAIIARRLRLPYTVGLLGAGIVLGLVRSGPHLAFTRDLVFLVLLPPLVFEAAINIDWPELKRDLIPVLLLATVGIAVAAAVVAGGMFKFAGWPMTSAVVFAMLISATDPVSVIATLKEFGIQGRLRLIIESESLLNDGTAAVGFSLALAWSMGEPQSALGGFGGFLFAAGGGVAIGFLIGQLGLIVAGRTEDHLLEISITIAMAYGSFLLAEQGHMSGVLAALAAGLVAGNTGTRVAFSPAAHEALETFWEVLAFLANSAVFLLMGVRLSSVPLVSYVVPTVIAIVFVLVGRAIAVYAFGALFSQSRWKISFPTQHVLVWGGLRGALALALVLGIPDNFPNISEVLAVTFGVVAFSVVGQGLTIKPLLKIAAEYLPLAKRAKEVRAFGKRNER